VTFPNPSHAFPDNLPEFQQHRLDWSVFRRMLSLSRHRTGQAFALLTIIAVASLLGLAPPLFFRLIVDHAIHRRNTTEIIYLGSIALTTYVVAQGLTAAGNYVGAKYSSGVIYDLRLAMFHKLLRMPHAFYVRTRPGMIISRFLNDTMGIQQLLTVAFNSILGMLLNFTFTIIIMAWLSWKVTVLVVLIIPALLVPSYFINLRVQVCARNQLTDLGALTSFLSERLDISGSLLIKVLGNSEAEYHRFSIKGAAVRNTFIRLNFFVQILTLSTALIGIAALVATYTYGSIEVAKGAITLGTMIALATYIMRATVPLLTLSASRSTLLQAQVSLERVFEILDAPFSQQIASPPDGIDVDHVLKSIPGALVCDHLCFQYPPATASFIPSLESPTQGPSVNEEPFALTDVSFVAAPGTTTALVGESGAGKSTLCAVIAGLYSPRRGKVLLGQRNLGYPSDKNVDRRVGLISQDAYFFHDSIANNLRLACPSASDQMLVKACEQANIDAVISRLPHGYHTIIGERGFRLSGGEKQRLAVARLLLTDPPLIILDEALAHIDSASEALVQKALDVVLRGRTILVVAHRLSTIIASDQILVMQKGRIVQNGNHATLIADEGGIYAKLFGTQLL